MAGLAVTCSKLCSFSTFGARSALISTRIKQGLTIRLLSSTQQNSRKVDKSLLSRLRKETGFGFAKCMEGLQASNNDYDTALTWLKAEAEKQGWEKAAKLQGRTAAEGLVGVLVDGNFGAMVEVNCETDFVARNELFVDLVSNVANTAMAKRKKIVDQNQKINTFAGEFEHLREVIPEHKLRNEEVKNSRETVAETVARTIGKLGENIKISKVVTMTTEVSNVIGSYAHGPFVKSVAGCSLGRYGGLVALRPKDSITSLNSVQQLANKVAQHVVGMNPKVIAQDGSGKNDSALDGETSDVLLEQEYLLDDSLTVKDFLEKEGVEVVDFVRYECGTQ